jgi:2-amino-4-hydroxy-6-hydroxymethyldihydropteridine diphosphokinase
VSEESVAYVSLGANVGEPASQLWEATRKLASHGRVALRGRSSLWRTSPVGPVADQPDFVNAVVKLVTSLSPRALLTLCRAIEDSMARDRSKEVPLGPRPIDLDILTFGDEILEEEDLVVPHPRLAERAFVLEPLREVDPDFVHPATGKAVEEMLAALPSEQKAERIGPLGMRFG